MISIDGYKWKVPCDIERVAEVRSSEISGMMLDKSYFNDVMGTFLSYDVTLAVPTSMEDEYSRIYEALTDPVDAHTFVFPYNQSTITITARVESVNDVLVYTASKKQYWRGIRFTAIANHPSASYDLGEVLRIGRSPMPDTVQVSDGSVWQYKDGEWWPYVGVLGTKTVTENGTYAASTDGYDGYSSVTVAIPSADERYY